MTVLGKILAVLNLVLSVVVGALIVFTYVARTNWHAAYQAVDKQLKVSQSDAQAFRKEADDVRGLLAKEQLAVKTKDTELAAARKDADTQVQAERTRHQAELKNAEEQKITIQSMSSELTRRQTENKYLKDLAARREDELAQQEKRLQGFKNEAVETRIMLRTMQEQNDRLLSQVETMSKTAQRSEQAGTTTPASQKKNPPTVDVEGVVKTVDAQSGYVTISIGSDAGVTRGNTLEVFRLRPEPKYLGTIEILSVRPNEAVGRPTARLNGLIQVGDRVSSRLFARG